MKSFQATCQALQRELRIMPLVAFTPLVLAAGIALLAIAVIGNNHRITALSKRVAELEQKAK